MSAQKSVSVFWLWLKMTLATFLLLLATSLIMPPLLTILRVPSFTIGNGMVWLLRWQNEPGVRFAVSFNPFTLLAIASVIGLVGVGIWANRQRRDRRAAKKQSSRKTLTSKGDRR
jgi:hypothetical protein